MRSRTPCFGRLRTPGASAFTGSSLFDAEVVADRVRDDEVAVGEPLHQRARAEPVRAVVGEVRFAEHVQAGDGAHQVVVHPEPAHRVVHGRIDAHRHLVRILVRDALVHLEEIAVALARSCPRRARLMASAKSRYTPQPARADAAAFVADFLRGARRDVARRRGCRSSDTCARGSSRARLPESRSAARLSPLLLRHPDAAVVAQRLATSASASTDSRRSRGMQVGWICVKHGLANAAPRLCARQIAVAFEPFALVER